MVALGTATDYFKDVFFLVLSTIWMVYGTSQILAAVFEIAAEIDKPVKCGVDVAAIAPFMNVSGMQLLPVLAPAIRRQLIIKDNCELRGGEYFIPYDIWSAERLWFDVMGISACIAFGSSTLGFLVAIVKSCKELFWDKDKPNESGDTEEIRMHKLQTSLDHKNGSFMLSNSTVCFAFLFIYGTVLNKLTAFGVWERTKVASVAQSKFSVAQEAVLDTGSWTDLFTPNLDELFTFDKPDTSHPQYLGTYVHNLAVFTVMTLFKNIYLAVVTAISDDLHIVSLLFVTPFAVAVIAFFYIPWLACIYCFKNIDLVNSMNFVFEFDDRLRTAFFGGCLFGINHLPTMFGMWIMPACLAGKRKWDEFVQKMQNEGGSSPALFDCTFWKETCKFLILNSPLVVYLYTFFGTIGLACLGWAAYDSDDSFAKEAYGMVLGFTLTGFVLVVVCLALRMSGRVPLDNVEPMFFTVMEDMKADVATSTIDALS